MVAASRTRLGAAARRRREQPRRLAGDELALLAGSRACLGLAVGAEGEARRAVPLFAAAALPLAGGAFHHDELEPCGMLEEIVEQQDAIAFFAPAGCRA